MINLIHQGKIKIQIIFDFFDFFYRYHQIPTPTKDEKPIPVHTKYRENTKPFVQHQIAIEIPQSSLPLTFNPSVGE